MANSFSNTKKTKLIAGAVIDAMDYVKASHSYMSQGELDGKKYGRSYKIYIPGTGHVAEGLDAEPDDVQEVEVVATLDNRNTSCELNAWNKLTDIESFVNEIAKPKGTMLGLSVQNEIIKNTYKHAGAAVVVSKDDQAADKGWGFKAISEGQAKLIQAGVAGDKVTFLNPVVNGAIAASGLANFIPDAIQKDIYGKNYLGEYAGASTISINGLPTITAAAATISVTVATADPVAATDPAVGTVTISDTGAAGMPVILEGLKKVDVNGIKTDEDAEYITGSGDELRAAVLKADGTWAGSANPNVWCEEGATVTAQDVLTAGKKYAIGIARSKDALGFDTYKFEDLPGSVNETVTVDGVSIKMSQYGDGYHMVTLCRLDCPFCAVVPDSRKQVLIYFEK